MDNKNNYRRFKILNLVLLTVAVVAVVIAIVLSVNFTNNFKLKYALKSDGTYEITGYTGKTKTLDIPSEYEGRAVTSIADCAFKKCKSLKSVTVPDSVTLIGSAAFSGCSSLEEMTIPFVGESVATKSSKTSLFGYIFGTKEYRGGSSTRQYYLFSYGETYCIPSTLQSVTVTGGQLLYGSFYNCSSLVSVTLGDGVTSIGDYSFEFCSSLTSVIIPDSVTKIGKYSFEYCLSLKSITIPDSLTSIGEDAFRSCRSLSNVYFNAVEMKDMKSDAELFKGVGYNTSGLTVTIGANVKRIPTYLFCNAAYLTTLKFAPGCKCTEIGNSAFDGCSSLDGVYISDIAAWCAIDFGNSSANPLYYARNLYLDNRLVNNLIIPDAVTSIGNYAFYNCMPLTSVSIPSSIKEIGTSAFYGCHKLIEVCNLSSLDITAGDSSNGYVAYYAKNVYTATNGESKLFTLNNEYVFYDDGSTRCLLEYTGTDITLTLPDDIGLGYEIYDYAFYNCTSLMSVVIPDSVTSIGSYSFYDCTSLTSVMFGAEITSIGNYAFYNCTSLMSVVIPDSVTSIGSYSFYDCTSLTSLTIGEGMISIGTHAFYNCTSLTEIYFNAVATDDLSSSDIVFQYAGQSDSGIIVTVGENVTKIPAYLFYSNNSLSYNTPKITTLVFESDSKCTSIGDYAFSYCHSLEKVYYSGSSFDWANISIGSNNKDIMSAAMYYYSEIEPASSGNFWHYVNGEIVVWFEEEN